MRDSLSAPRCLGLLVFVSIVCSTVIVKEAFPLRGKVPNGRMGEFKFFIFPHPSFGHLPPKGEGVLSWLFNKLASNNI
jgi:hypothetical protein